MGARELIAWCQERLAHYKVPAAVHILERMPTTGSGKIPKTELRRLYGGGSGVGASPASASSAAPPRPAISAAQAAAVLAEACGGGLAPQMVDEGLGKEWGRELLQELTYVTVAARVEQAQHLVRRWGTHQRPAAALPAGQGA